MKKFIKNIKEISQLLLFGKWSYRWLPYTSFYYYRINNPFLRYLSVDVGFVNVHVCLKPKEI